jgi:hypothetical protein
MTGSRGDAGRAAVYACEVAAFDGTDLEEVTTVDDIARVIDRLVADRWWPGPPVRVEAARRGAASSGTHGPVAASISVPLTIRIAAAQATTATAAHELAHALAGVEHGHDAFYRRAYLDVVEVITNLDPTDRRGDMHTRQLADAFAAEGLGVASRRWPGPAPEAGGAIVL